MDKNKKDKLKLMIGIVLCAAVMAVAYFAYSNLQNKAKPQLVTQDGDSFEDDTSSGKETLTPAPDIEVEDADGNLVKLSDFKGTPVIINLWHPGVLHANRKCLSLTKSQRNMQAKYNL